MAARTPTERAALAEAATRLAEAAAAARATASVACRDCGRPMAARTHPGVDVPVWRCINTACWLSY